MSDGGEATGLAGTGLFPERSEAARAQGEAALLELGDVLRDTVDPAGMVAAASEILLRILRVSRAGYGTVDLQQATTEILADAAAPGLACLAGRYSFQKYEQFISAMQAGEPVIYPPVAAEHGSPAANCGLALEGVQSAVYLPVMERGALVALVYLHDVRPRVWLPSELRFARAVADRTRASMARAAAEAALRGLAATLESEIAERTADRNRLWQLSADIMLVSRFDGVITAVNPAWMSVLGWTEQELLGRNLFEFIHPDDLEHTAASAATMATGAPVQQVKNRYRHKDGSYRWISWAAVPGGGLINAVGRDFTAEREKAEALEKSEARIRSVFDTTFQLQGLCTVEGIMVDANPHALASIAVPLSAIAGKPFWETPWFTDTEGMPELVKAAIPRVAAGETFRQEVVVNIATGRRAYDFAMRPVFNHSGEVIAIVPEAMDVTDRRASEEQLRQAQKMEAVGQLTGGLAHDFNNLLTGILGSLDVMRARIKQGKFGDVERYVIAAEGAAGRAASLTHRLLSFARRQTLEPRTIDASRLVAEMEDLIRRTAGPQIELETRLADALWCTFCDQNQLENALLNLCINARDAMPDGGFLAVETHNVQVDERIGSERDMAPGDYVAILVSDTGRGMAPDIIARAFDPFFTTKPLGQGTGLGLSMVYGFTKQSGGQVRIVSAEGQGTTMCLYLPRHVGEMTDAEGPAHPAGPPRARRGETVLVVDDEPTVRLPVTEVLRELGYSVLEASDGAAALQVLRSDVRIDLLVTDVGLPGGMNGRQVAIAGRAARPDLKVLFVTGYAEDELVGSGAWGPGAEVLTKPFRMDPLARRVREILSRG